MHLTAAYNSASVGGIWEQVQETYVNSLEDMQSISGAEKTHRQEGYMTVLPFLPIMKRQASE